jgi:hypothetical protein
MRPCKVLSIFIHVSQESQVPPTTADIVLVPVPTQHLDAVYRLLADLMARPSPPQNDEKAFHVDDRQGDWRNSMIDKLRKEIHLRAVIRLLDALAEAAPEEVLMQDFVAANPDIESNTLRAQMGAFTKLSSRLFGRQTWPFSVRYGDQGQAFYKMSTEIADWWLNRS